MEALIKRQKELNRKANVNQVEAECLLLEVGETKTFKIMDVEASQRLKMRLSRIKGKEGLSYETESDGNNVIVTRTA